ncbi:hypothetical protein, partial [Chromatium okenii]|uniref:hypothetical protein n=1 Tax=Chromatium okenii TaxID=61644 RepID=UPI0026F1D06E
DVKATDSATALNNVTQPVTITVTDDVTDNPTYAITAPTTAEEGKPAVFTVATTNVVDGTVLAYTLTGVTADDLVDANADGDANPLTGVNPLVGTATVTGNAATITVALAEDVILDEVETLTVTLDAPATGTANVLITDTSAPTKVAVTAPNDVATPVADASLNDFIFEIAAGNYTYNISGFGNDDQLDFPVGNEASVDNLGGFKDNAVDLTWSSAGQTVRIHLTGLATGLDAQLNFVSDFNLKTTFGANTII